MNKNYKKFANKFSSEGQEKFYSKIKKMKKDLEFISNPNTKERIETNIFTMIKSYENMKKYYFECVKYEKGIKEKNNLNQKLTNELLSKKIKYVQKTGFMHRDDFDRKLPFPKN